MATALWVAVAAAAAFWLYHRARDWALERSHRWSGRWNRDGFLHGLEPQARRSGAREVVLLVHGFTDSPEIFDQIVPRLPAGRVDWEAPLLPFHGRSLREMVDFDPWVIEEWLGERVEALARSHRRVYLVGQSLGGALLVNLAAKRGWDAGRFPLYLMAPAVRLRTDTRALRLMFRAAPAFRRYLGAGAFPSADEKALPKLLKSSMNKASVLPSLAALHAYCAQTEGRLEAMDRPHVVVVARDDNRVDAEALGEICRKNPRCRLLTFTHGRHILYWGGPIGEIAEDLAQWIEAHPPIEPDAGRSA